MPFKSLIDVRPPYYAFASAELERPGVAHAFVQPEHTLGHEEGPLAAAEAGRHLAILGACACSSLREPVGLHYYLAQRARLVRCGEADSSDQAGFRAVARSESGKGRDVIAHAQLDSITTGKRLFELDVSYKVLSQAAFQRVFAAHRRDLRAPSREDRVLSVEALSALRRNPYRQPLPLRLTQRTDQGVQAVLPEVTAEMCAGHFPLYPALPVAVLMHSLSTLCGEALRVRWHEKARYRVLVADVTAERLAFAGARLNFEAKYLGSSDRSEHYQATAMLEDGSSIGRMILELEPIPTASRTHPIATAAVQEHAQLT